MATVAQINKLDKKFKNITVKVVTPSENSDQVDVFYIKYQKYGVTPNQMSPGLMEANDLWDERKSRPPGYYIATTIETDRGYCTCIMVSEDWLDNNKRSDHMEAWAAL